jgi:hypothetical protein
MALLALGEPGAPLTCWAAPRSAVTATAAATATVFKPCMLEIIMPDPFPVKVMKPMGDD